MGYASASSPALKFTFAYVHMIFLIYCMWMVLVTYTSICCHYYFLFAIHFLSKFVCHVVTTLQLAKQFHPDTNKSDPEAEKKFQEVSKAYEVSTSSASFRRWSVDIYAWDGITLFVFLQVLKDEEKRAQYDQVQQIISLFTVFQQAK